MSDVDVETGAASFDDGDYYLAHEMWEEEWLESEGDDRALLHGLIQTAAAYVHLGRGNPEAAASLSLSAVDHLENVPDRHLAVDVVGLKELNHEVEERAREKLEGDRWKPLILRKPRFPWA